MGKSKRSPRGAVGTNVARKEGVEKVLGTASYIDDLSVANMLYGTTIRSTVPRGRITKVERDPHFDWKGFTWVDAADIPGKNVVALIEDDQPLLATERVNHQAEAIALLAHADRLRLEQGRAAVKVTYEAEPAVLTLDQATDVMKEIEIGKGDLPAGFRDADLVLEGVYTTGHQEQLYIETHGVIAMPPTGDLLAHVLGSMQCPYYVEKALCAVFAANHNQVRVVQTTTGGGFGGKEDYPSVIAAHACLLAKKSGLPVKMIYDRHEDLIATTKRHPAWTHHRTGVRRDGTIVAMDIDFRLDGGAYVTLSPVVLSRGSIHAAGPYRVPHVRVRGRVYRTNTPPNGAFRGFGAPQSIFAVEVHLDRIAEKLGLDPIALRRKNLLALGDTTATGQLLTESVSAVESLDAALAKHAAVHKKAKAEAKRAKQKPDDRPMLRGTGLAMFLHGSGFTGGGELRLQSRASLELTERGARILVSSTEIGQGTRTMLAQIVADAMRLPYDCIDTMDPDTAEVPDSGPTVASRTCMIVGKILERAADKMRKELGAYKTPREFAKLAKQRLLQGPFIVEEQYQRPAEMKWDDQAYRGDAYGAYAWGCNIVDIEVDPVTYAARATNCTAAIDIGKAIHPRFAEGQIEGGTLQAIGWALQEEVVMRDGKMQNANLTNYIIPTTLDAPDLHVVMIENPYKHGPQGAKGVGECPIDGPAAAVINALYAAGVPLQSIPATPERIAVALTAAAR